MQLSTSSRILLILIGVSLALQITWLAGVLFVLFLHTSGLMETDDEEFSPKENEEARREWIAQSAELLRSNHFEKNVAWVFATTLALVQTERNGPDVSDWAHPSTAVYEDINYWSSKE